MSNLVSTVKFDVVRGWPHGSAVEECFAPAASTTIKEGELVVLGSGGTVDHVGSVQTEGGTARDVYRMVIQGTDQSDANFVGKIATLRGMFTVKTEKFVAGSYATGNKLTVSVAGGSEGHLRLRTGSNEQIVGECEEYDSTNGILTAALNL